MLYVRSFMVRLYPKRKRLVAMTRRIFSPNESVNNSPCSICSLDTLRTCACCRSAELLVPQRRQHRWNPLPRGGLLHHGRCTPLCAPESLHRRSPSRCSTRRFSSCETDQEQLFNHEVSLYFWEVPHKCSCRLRC